MHSLFTKASEMTHDVIGSAIEVHKDKGPGLCQLGIACDLQSSEIASKRSTSFPPFAPVQKQFTCHKPEVVFESFLSRIMVTPRESNDGHPLICRIRVDGTRRQMLAASPWGQRYTNL